MPVSINEETRARLQQELSKPVRFKRFFLDFPLHLEEASEVERRRIPTEQNPNRHLFPSLDVEQAAALIKMSEIAADPTEWKKQGELNPDLLRAGGVIRNAIELYKTAASKFYDVEGEKNNRSFKEGSKLLGLAQSEAREEDPALLSYMEQVRADLETEASAAIKSFDKALEDYQQKLAKYNDAQAAHVRDESIKQELASAATALWAATGELIRRVLTAEFRRVIIDDHERAPRVGSGSPMFTFLERETTDYIPIPADYRPHKQSNKQFAWVKVWNAHQEVSLSDQERFDAHKARVRRKHDEAQHEIPPQGKLAAQISADKAAAHVGAGLSVQIENVDGKEMPVYRVSNNEEAYRVDKNVVIFNPRMVEAHYLFTPEVRARTTDPLLRASSTLADALRTTAQTLGYTEFELRFPYVSLDEELDPDDPVKYIEQGEKLIFAAMAALDGVFVPIFEPEAKAFLKKIASDPDHPLRGDANHILEIADMVFGENQPVKNRELISAVTDKVRTQLLEDARDMHREWRSHKKYKERGDIRDKAKRKEYDLETDFDTGFTQTTTKTRGISQADLKPHQVRNPKVVEKIVKKALEDWNTGVPTELKEHALEGVQQLANSGDANAARVIAIHELLGMEETVSLDTDHLEAVLDHEAHDGNQLAIYCLQELESSDGLIKVVRIIRSQYLDRCASQEEAKRIFDGLIEHRVEQMIRAAAQPDAPRTAATPDDTQAENQTSVSKRSVVKIPNVESSSTRTHSRIVDHSNATSPKSSAEPSTPSRETHSRPVGSGVLPLHAMVALPGLDKPEEFRQIAEDIQGRELSPNERPAPTITAPPVPPSREPPAEVKALRDAVAKTIKELEKQLEGPVLTSFNQRAQAIAEKLVQLRRPQETNEETHEKIKTELVAEVKRVKQAAESMREAARRGEHPHSGM